MPKLNSITNTGDKNLSKWIKACSLDQVSKGELFGFDYKDKRILLANLDGKIYASDLICTHAEADLSTGFLTEEGVRCPLHLSVFDLKSGEPQNPPAVDSLKIYNVKVDDNEVFVEV